MGIETVVSMNEHDKEIKENKNKIKKRKYSL